MCPRDESEVKILVTSLEPGESKKVYAIGGLWNKKYEKVWNKNILELTLNFIHKTGRFV